MSKDKKEQGSSKGNVPAIRTKKVRNRSNSRVELFVNGEVVVIQPKQTVELPYDFDVPNGVGLYVRE